jgi:predicted XRE-type DNA-binding protein
MNWQKLIADLQARGLRQVDIAALCGCTQSSISDLARGLNTKPSFVLGQALIELHKSRRKGPIRVEAEAKA